MHTLGRATEFVLQADRGAPHYIPEMRNNPINVVVFDSEPTITETPLNLPQRAANQGIAVSLKPPSIPVPARNEDHGDGSRLPLLEHGHIQPAFRERASSHHAGTSMTAKPGPSSSLNRAPPVRHVVFSSNSTEIVDRHVTFSLSVTERTVDSAHARNESSLPVKPWGQNSSPPSSVPVALTAQSTSIHGLDLCNNRESLSSSLFATPAQSLHSLESSTSGQASSGSTHVPPPVRVHPIGASETVPSHEDPLHVPRIDDGQEQDAAELDDCEPPRPSVSPEQEPNPFRRGVTQLFGSLAGLGTIPEASMSPVTLKFRDAVLEERFMLFSARLSEYPMFLFSWAISVSVVAQMLMISRSLSAFGTIIQGCPMIRGTCYECQHVIFYWVALLTATLFLLLFTSRKRRSWERQRRHVLYSFIFAGFVASHLGGTVCGGLCRIGQDPGAKVLVDSTLDLSLACGTEVPLQVLESLKWLEASLETRTTAASAYMFLLIAATSLPMHSAVLMGVSLLVLLTLCYAILVPSNSSLLWLLLGSLIHDTIKAAFALYQREVLIRISFLLAAQESPFLRVTEKQTQYGGTLPNGISNVAVSLAFLLQPLPTLQRRGIWGGKSTMRVGMRSQKASTFSVPGGLRLQPPAASGSTPRERLFLAPKSAADSSRFLAAGSGDDEMAASPKFSRSRFQSLHATPVASTSLFRTIAAGAGTSNAKSDALLATSSLAFPPLPKTLDREVAPSTHMPLPRPSVSDPVPVTVTQFSDLLAQIPTNIIDPASLDPSDLPIEPAKTRISKKLRNIANSIHLFVLSQLALVSYQFPAAEQELAYHAFYLRNLLGRIRVTLALSVISSGLSFSLLAVIRTSMSGFSTSTASWWLNQWIAGSDGRDTLVSVGVLLVVLVVPQLPWTRTLPLSRRRWIELVAVLYAIAIMSLAKTSDIMVHQARSATADRAGIQITNHRVVHSLFTLTTLRLRPKVHLSILAGAFVAAVIELGVFWNSPVLGERARIHSIVAIGTIMGSVTLCLLFEISSRKYFWLKEVVGQGNGTLGTSHRAPIDVENE